MRSATSRRSRIQNSPDAWCTRLIATDAFDWPSEGLTGGAYHKVIRWAFEVQGLFRPAGAANHGYIRRAAAGGRLHRRQRRPVRFQPYLAELAGAAHVWNRRFPDGGTTHEQPLSGFPGNVYVRVRNRGTGSATNPSVKLFQADPASGLEWPAAWTAAATAQLAAGGPIPSGGQRVVGPFSWTAAAAGPVSLLASASATGDASNAAAVSGPIEHWRLIPNDNNLAQRDVTAATANPCEQMGALADYIATLGLQQGLQQSLTVKLRNAKRDCERGEQDAGVQQAGGVRQQGRGEDRQRHHRRAGDGAPRAHSAAIRSVLGC